MGQPELFEEDAIREAFACPECTANRGEYCRDRHGAGAPMHESRIERYRRESDHATRAPAGVEITASARGTVTPGEVSDSG